MIVYGCLPVFGCQVSGQFPRAISVLYPQETLWPQLCRRSSCLSYTDNGCYSNESDEHQHHLFESITQYDVQDTVKDGKVVTWPVSRVAGTHTKYLQEVSSVAQELPLHLWRSSLSGLAASRTFLFFSPLEGSRCLPSHLQLWKVTRHLLDLFVSAHSGHRLPYNERL